MSEAITKYAINSTLGTASFKPLNELVSDIVESNNESLLSELSSINENVNEGFDSVKNIINIKKHLVASNNLLSVSHIFGPNGQRKNIFELKIGGSLVLSVKGLTQDVYIYVNDSQVGVLSKTQDLISPIPSLTLYDLNENDIISAGQYYGESIRFFIYADVVETAIEVL